MVAFEAVINVLICVLDEIGIREAMEFCFAPNPRNSNREARVIQHAMIKFRIVDGFFVP